MRALTFPADVIVGNLDWAGSWSDERGPVLATGTVLVPDDAEIELHTEALSGSERDPGGASWSLIPDRRRPELDLGFLRQLPADAITSLSLGRSAAGSVSALAHLAPGLRRLYLGWTGFGDEVLPFVARLVNLTYLQTFGNHFSDAGVQQLSALQQLDHLYLEEETLTAAGFAFAAALPRLQRLGLQDVPLTDAEMGDLRQRLSGVDVG